MSQCYCKVKKKNMVFFGDKKSSVNRITISHLKLEL